MKICFESVLLEFVTGGPVRICFNDVGACFDVFPMNLADKIRIAQVQLVVTTVDVNTFRIEHGAHRAIHDVDTIGFEKLFERKHVYCRFPIANCRFETLAWRFFNRQLAIGNRQ
jgi:hypothetical protein